MAYETIHNYYEHLVLEKINELIEAEFLDADSSLFEDIACVALNQLPARYVRYDIDMAYYMTIKERDQMEYDVHRAVTGAIEYVSQNKGKQSTN